MRPPSIRSAPALARHGARVLNLLRWLGPWADASAAPEVTRSHGERPLRHVVWRGRGAAAAGAPTLLLIPGLHFLGPDDPRFQRLAAVLASTGAEVVAPYLTDVMALILSPRLLEEASAALALASERAQAPVGVMSISFGSIAALHLAATHPERVRRVVVFGGYRDLETTFRFALGGTAPGFAAELRDPLNGPAVLANLTEELLPEPERRPFREAALAFSRRTWSRGPSPEDKRDGRHLVVGHELAQTLSGEARALFRVACRLEGDPLEVATRALETARRRVAFLDPGPLLPRVSAPVTCVHGRDDDVIPWTEAAALASDLPRARALVTGLYGHTGRAAGGGERPGLGALGGELATMAQVLHALALLTGDRA
jgi:pimeloyl-ACP methyl ester carboxylesterase